MTDNPAPVEPIADALTVARFPLERRKARSVEFMQMLSLDRDDVVEVMKEAGQKPPYALSTLKREGAREVRSRLREWDLSVFADAAELEDALRAWFQPAVTLAISETAEARDLIIRERQIRLATNVEQRLMDTAYRQQRAHAAQQVSETWILSGRIIGGWEVVIACLERYREGRHVRKAKSEKLPVSAPVQSEPVVQDGNVVSLGAWRNRSKGTG
ncbi:hypothetical protein KSAC_34560 (plasmid) [Komagataeibacter saccharivorans]|uniref:hypothetical protein n=1 Tax=Komagataeibacter saccharivorans TaxID=265959 RepID=UPI00104B7578|nr:hypothetical protein [Komagataeibacter saccharivorans]QBL95635.1 hypothetical protein KSAC_34560 [Komagataeibacter saccharivorans]